MECDRLRAMKFVEKEERSAGFQTMVLALMLSFGVFCAPALAESPGSRAEKPPEKFNVYPGEEVTTSSGKKMKIWSTRGPVETMNFQNGDSATVSEIEVVVPLEKKRGGDLDKPIDSHLTEDTFDTR